MKIQCRNCLFTVANSSRLNIVDYLKKNTKEITVNDVVNELSLRQPTVTFHINKLVKAGILKKKRSGRQVFVRLFRLSPACAECPVFV